MTIPIQSLDKDLFTLNKLYRDILSFNYSSSDTDKKRKLVTRKLDLIKNGLVHDKKIAAMLREANESITEELKKAEKDYGDIEESMRSAEVLVRKLEKIETMNAKMRELRRTHGSLRMEEATLTGKVWVLQEELHDLRKSKEKVAGEHKEMMETADKVVGLRMRVLPVADLLEYKEKIARESAGNIKAREEKDLIANDLSNRSTIKADLQEEHDKLVERIPLIKDHINSLKKQVGKIAPKVISDEEAGKLDEEYSELKKTKDSLTEEKNIISPQMSGIAEEEEKLSEVYELYKAKISKEKKVLSELKKAVKGIDLDEASVGKLRDEVSAVESDLESKRMEFGNIKKEYDEVLESHQKHKAVIDEVGNTINKLKAYMAKRKKTGKKKK